MSQQQQQERILKASPQERFQSAEQNVRKHRELVDLPEFERGADAALLQYQSKLCARETNPTVIGLKLAGANEFLETFKLLSEKAALKPLPKPNDNLSDQ